MLTLEDGAKVDIVSDGKLTIADASALVFDANINSAEEITQLSVANGGTLVFEAGARVIVNLSGNADDADGEIYTIINGSDSTVLSGAETLVKNETVFVYGADGKAYAGDWDIVLNGNSIAISIPEPSACAALLGLVSLFMIVRRRSCGAFRR